MIINLDDHSLIQISGPDAKTFLQGQLTCDLDNIDENLSNLGAHCNRKGRIMSLFRLFYRDNVYYLCMANNVIEQAITALKKYAIFSKVELTIINPNCYGFIGRPIELEYPIDGNAMCHGVCTIIRVQNDERYLIIDFSDKLNLDGENCKYWHQAEIKAGVPRLYPQTVGKFLPHYLNLPILGAVSFTKGCYTGQEVIARMEHRGKLKKKMQFIELESTQNMTPGEKHHDDNGHDIGQIIDYVDDGNKQLCLIVPRENDCVHHI